MKHYIVGAFNQETWAAHGKRWLASVHRHKGDAQVIVFHTSEASCEGAKAVKYDGTLASVFRDLSKRDGVFLYAAPNVRFQAHPAIFDKAQAKFAVVPRQDGHNLPERAYPVHEEYWAAPADLIDLLVRAVDLSVGTGNVPANFDARYVGYFAEFFPWFRETVDPTEFMSVYDAEGGEDAYLDPKTLRRLTAVGLDRPEPKKTGVFGTIVKPTKPLLTTEAEDGKIRHDSSSAE